jgi:hypothetical protein
MFPTGSFAPDVTDDGAAFVPGVTHLVGRRA